MRFFAGAKALHELVNRRLSSNNRTYVAYYYYFNIRGNKILLHIPKDNWF